MPGMTVCLVSNHFCCNNFENILIFASLSGDCEIFSIATLGSGGGFSCYIYFSLLWEKGLKFGGNTSFGKRHQAFIVVLFCCKDS